VSGPHTPTVVFAVSLYPILPAPGPSLFPYTTLFRSRPRVTPQFSWLNIEAFLKHDDLPEGRQPPQPKVSNLGWGRWRPSGRSSRSEEHTSELQSLAYLVCRLLLEKKTLAHSSRRPLT